MIDPRSRTRNKQVVRIIRIIALLQAGWWSTSGLAKKLHVSPRTIRRDWAAISHGRILLKDDGIKSAWTLNQPGRKARP